MVLDSKTMMEQRLFCLSTALKFEPIGLRSSDPSFEKLVFGVVPVIIAACLIRSYSAKITILSL